MNTQTTPTDTRQNRLSLNAALAGTGIQVHWSNRRRALGILGTGHTHPTRISGVYRHRNAVAACIEIHARRKHAIYRDHALNLE